MKHIFWGGHPYQKEFGKQSLTQRGVTDFGECTPDPRTVLKIMLARATTPKGIRKKRGRFPPPKQESERNTLAGTPTHKWLTNIFGCNPRPQVPNWTQFGGGPPWGEASLSQFWGGWGTSPKLFIQFLLGHLWVFMFFMWVFNTCD